MCQLTFINLRDLSMSKKLLLCSLIFNSDKNDDGCGFYQNGFLFKTEVAGYLIANLGDIINKGITTPAPIISHVRLASTGSEIKKEFSHPFETEKIVLAHNGTLSKKSGDIEKELDTIKFLKVLDNKYNENLPKAPIETMSEFEGKFAFLIYDKNKNKYYAARGRTATLFMTDINIKRGNSIVKLGYVINTELSYLNYITRFLINTYLLEGKKVSLSPIQELDKESIFELKNDSIIKVGEIKETERAVTIYHPLDRSYSALYSGSEKEKSSEEKYAKILGDFCNKYALSYVELDYILLTLFGRTRLNIEEQMLKEFIDGFIPLIQFGKSARKFVNKYVDKNGYLDYAFYNEKNIQFPYFLNSAVEIIESLKNRAKKE